MFLCAEYGKWFDNCATCKKCIDTIKALVILLNKIRKYSDTEEFRQKPTTPTHNETVQGWPNDRKPTLVYPIIIKELPAVDRHFQSYEEVK